MPRAVLVPPRGRVGAGAVACDDPEIIGGYLRDASQLTGSASCLFRPENEADIAATLARAHREGVPLTVVAAQTSTTASSVPMEGWVLSTERLTEIGEVDAKGLSATCEPGVILGAFQARVAGEGLLFPPDPTSRYECSVGGAVLCNASGPRSHRYGATRNWVRGLRVVLTCGEVLELSRGQYVARRGECFELVHRRESAECALRESANELREGCTKVPVPGFSLGADIKNAAGYVGGDEVDLIDLFIGSEGTLGVVSEVHVELLPSPAGCLSLFVFFGSEASALDLIEQTRERNVGRSPMRPDSIEWFDRASLSLIAEAVPSFDVPDEAQVALFMEQMTSTEDPDASLIEGWLELLEANGAIVEGAGAVRVAQTAEQHEQLRFVRHAVPTGVNERVAQNGMPKLGTDLAVGDAHLRTMLDLYHRAADAPLTLLSDDVLRELTTQCDVLEAGAAPPATLDAVSFGHVSDNHLHVNFLPQSEPELLLARSVIAELTHVAVGMGGSVSAEHGIGKTKRAALRQQVGECGVNEMLAVKKALDPRLVLGRGNLFEYLDPA